MVATGLPISTTASTTTSANPADSTPGSEDAGGFLGMLAQMLTVTPAAVGVPALAAGTTTTPVETETGDESMLTTGLLPAALLSPLLNTAVAAKAMSVNTGVLQGVAREGAVAANGSGLAFASKLTGEQLLAAVSGEIALELPALDEAKTLEIPALASSAPTVQSTSLLGLVSEPGIPVKSESPAVSLHVQTKVGTSGWSEEVGTRLQWMIDKGQSSASVRLNPEHLGPLEVQINVQDDKASVWFGAANAETRAAIENAMPRLRELLASQGLSLAQSGVFHEAPRQQAQESSSSASSIGISQEMTVESQTAPAAIVQRMGLVDTYA